MARVGLVNREVPGKEHVVSQEIDIRYISTLPEPLGDVATMHELHRPDDITWAVKCIRRGDWLALTIARTNNPSVREMKPGRNRPRLVSRTKRSKDVSNNRQWLTRGIELVTCKVFIAI